MKSRAILVFLIAMLAVTAFAGIASAGSLGVSSFTVSIKGADVTGATVLSAGAGETIPIRVVFDAQETVTDVRMKAYVEGYRSNIEARTERFKIVNGTTYSELLSLKLPDDVDPAEDYTLYVRVGTKTNFKEESYKLKIQRTEYNIEILSVDTARSVAAGSNLNIDVVLKNRGSERLDDTFVVAKIPELGVEKKAYFSDLTPVDECTDCDKEDAAERVITLKIPSDAKAGVYTLEVEAYNADSSTSTTKTIAIAGNEQISDVLTAVTSKEISSGATETYDLVIVNSGSRIGIYEVIPESAQNLIVTVDEPIVTVPADSSKVVKVNVKGGDTTGTFNFGVSVKSQGELVKRVNLAANVVKGSVASNVVILTVVLAVIFVVLLVVLIVLLTRKPEKVEEFGESYY